MRSEHLLPVLCAVALAVPPAAQEPVDLRIRAEPGAPVWLLHRQVQSQEIDLGGQYMDTGSDLSFTTRVRITEVDDEGRIHFELHLARVQGTMKLPMVGDLQFDSAGTVDAEAEEPFPGMGAGGAGKAVAALAGRTFRGTVDAHGRLSSEIDGAAAALKEARQQGGTMGGQLLTGILGDGLIERLVESAFGLRPAGPVAVGAAWDREQAAAGGRGVAAQKMKLTLSSADEDSFAIAVTGTVEPPAAPAAPAAAGGGDQGAEATIARRIRSEMKIRNGKVEGSQRSSRRDGFVIEAAQDVTMEIDTASPMGGQMSILVRSKATIQRTTEADALPRAEAGDAKKKTS